MSLAAESPVHSSSSDDFASLLETDLLSNSSGESPERDEDILDEITSESVSERSAVWDSTDYEEIELERIKRPKICEDEEIKESQSSNANQGELDNFKESTSEKVCPPHPGFYKDMCIRCGEQKDDETVARKETAVAFNYIHKDLKLGAEEVARLRATDLKNLYRRRKLYLVLDLDHTLLNSTRLVDVSPEEEAYLNATYLNKETSSSNGDTSGTLFKLEPLHMLTKLRPFVRTFLKEANTMFEMYVYTMGERAYALEMAKLLDPSGVYFGSRVISQGDSTVRHQKGLDVVLGSECAVVILDDTEHVLKTIQSEVLKGCRLVFSRIFPTNYPVENQTLWRIAEQLGASCSKELDEAVTHVVSLDLGTEKARWAIQRKKHLVNPGWLEATNYFWKRQPEDQFPIPSKNGGGS
ncbi:RNA polymerase II C-terminal domain phosphatase-like 4 isoform X2 [Amborella trichopoda]|uniref:RNA polymerase II C-terminal domain phosphatase-like 4 isoform X2 n=1 Tax=Amborella trichopoda TaxID=13333 RepID=UPI0009BE4D05|nr:RNA polymerase II C-terminal domain phosphatase-like 4 isoform X2 [Amborella trichopoda]|eukprot:XP_020519618.1 RNA polymerase II C-terminal domain phosphatase-like 4 isoform X2 [Amborella trichopoda]